MYCCKNLVVSPTTIYVCEESKLSKLVRAPSYIYTDLPTKDEIVTTTCNDSKIVFSWLIWWSEKKRNKITVAGNLDSKEKDNLNSENRFLSLILCGYLCTLHGVCNCCFVTDKFKNDWTDRDKHFWGNSHDPREGLLDAQNLLLLFYILQKENAHG